MPKINNLFRLPLLLLFFPAFCIWISVKPIVIYFVAIIAVFAITLFLQPKFLYTKLKTLYNISAFRYYLLFVLWCIISGIILVCFGRYKLTVFLYYIFSLLLVDYGMTYVLPFMVYKRRFFNIRTFAKLLLIIYFIIFVIGILEFLGKTFDISLFTLPSEFFGNQRSLNNDIFVEYVDRVRSIFAEPGWLGGFIFFNIPILYSLSLSKFKIFKTNILNLVIKKSLIPLLWVTIFIEQSAIWLIFNSLLTLFYFRKCIINLIYKYFGMLVVTFLFIILFIMFFLSSDTSFDLGFYNRIFNFFSNITDFDTLVSTDQSLGTRLVSYVITVKIGIKNWLLGVGLGNTAYVFPGYYLSLKLPYVRELDINYLRYITEAEKMHFSGVIPYVFFAELGIVGLSLFYLFIFKTIKKLDNVKKYFYNLEYDFVNGLSFSLVSTSIILFYDIGVHYYYIWFLFGLSNIFLYKAYLIKKSGG